METQGKANEGRATDRHLTPALSPVEAERESARDEFLTKKELAARLKVTERTIERWQQARLLPYLKVQTVVMFHWQEVLAHLNTHFKVNSKGSVKPSSTPHGTGHRHR